MKTFMIMLRYELKRSIPLAGTFWVFFTAVCAAILLYDIVPANKLFMIYKIVIPAAVFSHPFLLWHRFKTDRERTTHVQLYSLPVRRWPLFAASAVSITVMLALFAVIVLKTHNTVSTLVVPSFADGKLPPTLSFSTFSSTIALAVFGIALVLFAESCGSMVRRNRQAVVFVSALFAGVLFLIPVWMSVSLLSFHFLLYSTVASLVTVSTGLALLEKFGDA